MLINQLVKDYMAANPKAKPREIALACRCSVKTVYNVRSSLKTKLNPVPSDAKLLSKREREIKIMQETESVLLRKIKHLMADNQLYAERELKLKGVIDYLEAKVEDGAAV